MVMETIDKVIQNLGTADISQELEETLVGGCLYATQERLKDESTIILNGFATVVTSLGVRSKAYLPQITGLVKWWLNNKSAKIRQQAADLIEKIADVLKLCGEDKLLRELARVLFENLGEEYPEVLGSILGALKAVVHVLGMT